MSQPVPTRSLSPGKGVTAPPAEATSPLTATAPTAESAPGDTGDGAIDLGALGGLGPNDFTPYVFDRSASWALLPLLALALVALHLKKNRPPKPRRPSDAST